jgi:hypothetical protein
MAGTGQHRASNSKDCENVATIVVSNSYMSKPSDEKLELHAYDERVKLLLLTLFGVALVTIVGFSLRFVGE